MYQQLLFPGPLPLGHTAGGLKSLRVSLVFCSWMYDNFIILLVKNTVKNSPVEKGCGTFVVFPSLFLHFTKIFSSSFVKNARFYVDFLQK